MPTKRVDDRDLLSKEANRALNAVLEPGERVVAIVRGTYGTSMFGTGHRSFVWKKKNLRVWPHAQLSGIEADYGLLLKWAALRGPALDPRKPSLATIADDESAVQLTRQTKQRKRSRSLRP